MDEYELNVRIAQGYAEAAKTFKDPDFLKAAAKAIEEGRFDRFKEKVWEGVCSVFSTAPDNLGLDSDEKEYVMQRCKNEFDVRMQTILMDYE